MKRHLKLSLLNTGHSIQEGKTKMAERRIYEMALFNFTHYLGTTATNQNFIHVEIKNRLNPGNTCHILFTVSCLSFYSLKTERVEYKKP
jgi:hypothetical protein